MATFPSLSLSTATAKFAEGNSGSTALKLTATLSQVSTTATTFTATAKNGTATSNLDFQAYTKLLTIPAGQTQVDFFIQVLGDKLSETNETFSVELSKLSTNAIFANDLGILPLNLTILDDDKPVIRMDDIKIAEGDNGLHDADITVYLNTAATSDVSVSYTTSDGTAKNGSDYISESDTLVIPKGSKEGHIKISIQGDTTPETTENFRVELSNAMGAILLNSADTLSSTVTITTDDDKNLPVLAVKAKPVDEGSEDEFTDYPITFTLSSSPATDVTVHYETKDGTARDGSDYQGKSGDIIFLAGETQSTLNITVLGDIDIEDDEEFVLQLSNPTGLKFSDGQPTQDINLLIRDDDQGTDTTPQKLEGTPKNDTLDATTNGGYGDDSLDGKQGADTMMGGDGNDTYYVDNIKDVITEEDQAESAAGDDDIVHSTASSYTLPANVEHLIIDGKSKGNATGNELNNSITGNAAVNTLLGLEGDDTFDSGSGNDTLSGGDGADTYIFSSGIKGSKNVDTIKDFVSGEDKILLSADIFTKLATALGVIDGNDPTPLSDGDFFVAGAKVKPTDATSYILYDTNTGRVYYDADGNGKGAADWFITLTGKPELIADDFYIA
jgi:Ca2+-binding RTX toxin-like protein